MDNYLSMTRTLLCFTFLFVQMVALQAQQKSEEENLELPKMYLGLGLGINDYGIGGSIEIPLSDALCFYGNSGLGGWGWRLGGGISFYPSRMPLKSSWSIGYATASGFSDFETTLDVAPNDATQAVLLDLNRVGTVNLTYAYNIRTRNNNKWVLSTGYAIPITTNSYEILSEGVVLTDLSKEVIEVMQPGGLILGFKFLFGLDQNDK